MGSLFLVCFLYFQPIQAQDDLLALVGPDKPKKERVKYAFKSPRVINGHSMEFLNPGTMDFRILHRFGPLDQGYKNFFGFDQANMRIGLDFGLLHNLMVGIGRSNVKKKDTLVAVIEGIYKVNKVGGYKLIKRVVKRPSKPSAKPVKRPSKPSAKPTKRPSKPSAKPTKRPAKPSAKPSAKPTKRPAKPSAKPTKRPAKPSAKPTKRPVRK